MYDKLTEVTKAVDSAEEIEKGVDTIEHVEKFNPFHDSLGRFSSSKGMKSYSANPKTKAGAMAIERSTKSGYGAVMNVHRESKGENIYQNDVWIKGGKAASPSARARAQANNPQSPAAAAARARTNRVKGTMGATKENQALHPQRPKKPAQQQNNQQQSQKQNQQAQQNQQQTAAKTVRVTQKMKSGATMDADFDTSTVAGAKNKEFRGTAQGKDLTKSFDATTMKATDKYGKEDRFTDKVADMQGFNSPMKRVSQAEFDKLARDNGDIFMREVGPTSDLNGRPATAKQLKKAYSTENDMKMNGPSGRVYGDGIYTASAAMKVHNSGRSTPYTSSLVQNSIRREVSGYGDGQTVMKMAWVSKPKIANQAAMQREFNKLSAAERAKFGNHLNTYVCAKGYDAMRTSGSDCYMVVFNRSKVAILDD